MLKRTERGVIQGRNPKDDYVVNKASKVIEGATVERVK
jgi:hypothetical protein